SREHPGKSSSRPGVEPRDRGADAGRARRHPRRRRGPGRSLAGERVPDRLGLPRWPAVAVVLAVTLGGFIGFLAAAIPVIATQATDLAENLPHYLHEARNHSTQLGKI